MYEITMTAKDLPRRTAIKRICLHENRGATFAFDRVCCPGDGRLEASVIAARAKMLHYGDKCARFHDGIETGSLNQSLRRFLERIRRFGLGGPDEKVLR